MSTNFFVYPTKRDLLKCEDIIEYSVRLFKKYLYKENINYKIHVGVREVSLNKSEINFKPVSLISTENLYLAFRLNDEGEVYVFYHQLTELDEEVWDEEMEDNKKAQLLQKMIYENRDIGYHWSIKRTMGQPAAVSLYYGYLAIAIAVLTDGFIYSDDGAWDYASFPVLGGDFKEEYLNVNAIENVNVKENITNWLNGLREKIDS